VPIWISLLVIVGSVAGGVISSLRATRPKPDDQPQSGGPAGHVEHAEHPGSAEANGPAKG
jgi:hypothetical protein